MVDEILANSSLDRIDRIERLESVLAAATHHTLLQVLPASCLYTTLHFLLPVSIPLPVSLLLSTSCFLPLPYSATPRPLPCLPPPPSPRGLSWQMLRLRQALQTTDCCIVSEPDRVLSVTIGLFIFVKW